MEGSIRSITQAFSVKIEEFSSDDRQKLIARVPYFRSEDWLTYGHNKIFQ